MVNGRANLVLCCAAIALGVLAQPAPAYAGGEARTHDGFFMRLSTGFGSAKSKLEDSGTKVEIKGVSGDVNLAFGAVVSPNLALHGTLWGWTISDPDLEITGLGSGSTNGTLTMGAIGPGLTYYFMPMNAYVSGSFGLGSLLGEKDVEGKTKTGFAMDVTVGKEWWVGNAWALGLAGDVSFFSAKNDDFVNSNESWSGPGFGLRFSATFN